MTLADHLSLYSPVLVMNLANVTRVVCHHFDITESELLTIRKAHRQILARQLMAWIMRDQMAYGIRETGDILGGLRTGTVCNSLTAIRDKVQFDEPTFRQCSRCLSNLGLRFNEARTEIVGL
jgi:chromosomal replication initiation ATPase DnaA